MSYIKKLQAFGKLKGVCTGLGGAYNPGQQHLQVKALTTLQFNAQQVMDEVTAARTAYDNVTNQRETAFKEVRLLGSRVCFLLRSCGVDPLTLADALSANRRLNGWRRYAAPMPTQEMAENTEPTKAKRRRGAGNDYASIAYHFAKLVETVTAEPLYVAKEHTLSKQGLAEKVAALYAQNEAVLKATLELNRLRTKRDALFYEGKESLVETARAAKNYVRGVFGFRSAPREELAKVSFTKPTT